MIGGCLNNWDCMGLDIELTVFDSICHCMLV
jgi:hypothetical protein